MLLPIILLGVIISLILIYLIGNSNERYWRKKGVKFHNKNKRMGPFWDMMIRKESLFEAFGRLYHEHRKEPAVGIGSITAPALFVINPQNMHAVLQSDFMSFNHRGFDSLEGDQLSDNILFMNGPRWKLMRQNMTPLFTATKLKNMFYIMNKSSKDLIEYLKNNPKKMEGGCFATLTTFCNAAVCSTIFGITSESIFESPFVTMAEEIAKPTFTRNLKFIVMSLCPNLANLLKLKLFAEHEDFFIEAITRCIKQREKDNVVRHDFADICVSIQKNGIMKDVTTNCELEPTFGLLAAQAFFFFIAGVEPCATAIFTTLVLLDRNREVLAKLQQEIDESFENNKGQITYDVVTGMEYLNKVLSEAMRMFPPIGILSRKCVKDTTLPVGNIRVEAGTQIFTPIYHVHYDPEYYPEPHVFDPERFSKERHPSEDIYMPFGRGNRMCIGSRYARLQVLATLIHILRHFDVKSTQKGDRIMFKKDPAAVRPMNLDVQFIPRKTAKIYSD